VGFRTCRALGLLILSAVSHAESDPSNSIGPLDIPVKSLNTAGELSALEDRSVDWVLMIGAIGGNIAGATDPLQALLIGHAQSFRWDPDTQSGSVGRHVARLDKKFGHALSSSVTLVPKDARFARIATTVWSKTKPDLGKAVGWVDSETGNELVLLYFDRPCRLSGSLTLKSLSHDKLNEAFNVEVPSAGWLWLQIEHVDPLHSKVSRAVSPHPALVIAPPERFRHIHR